MKTVIITTAIVALAVLLQLTMNNVKKIRYQQLQNTNDIEMMNKSVTDMADTVQRVIDVQYKLYNESL